MKGVSTDDRAAVEKESPRDGIDSSEIVRVENVDSTVLSLIDISSSSSRSSGALSSNSMGLLPNVKLSAFSDTCACSMIASTVNGLSLDERRKPARRPGGGMLVTASKAATEGGRSSTFRGSRRRDLELLHFSW